jgi:hypothetical protein
VRPESRLCAIKGIHTLVWTVFAGSIIAIPIYAFCGNLARSSGRSNAKVVNHISPPHSVLRLRILPYKVVGSAAPAGLMG